MRIVLRVSTQRNASGRGSLYKRHRGRDFPSSHRGPGTYYVRYSYVDEEGNRVRARHRLLDGDGEPCTSLQAARQAFDNWMAMFAARDKEQQLAAVHANQTKIQTKVQDLVEKVQGEIHPPILLSEAWDVWEGCPDRLTPSEDTMRNYEIHWDQFCRWMADYKPGAVSVDLVAPDFARAYVKHIKKDLAAGTVNKKISFLSSFFDQLANDPGASPRARIETNPFAHIRKEKNKPAKKRTLKAEELREIIEAADGELQTLFVLGLATGLRLGDCCRLRWEEIDLEDGVIHTAANKNGRELLVGIPPFLARQIEDIEQDEFLLPELAERYARDRGGISRLIQRHFERCGIKIHSQRAKGKRPVVEVGFHSLRHTFVTLQLEGGASRAQMEKLVGHASPQMRRHYSHVRPEAARQLAANIADPLGEGEALPPIPRRTRGLVELFEGMNAGNWRAIRDAVLTTKQEK